jgi:predicted GNAT family acetyltransferase
LVRILHPGDEVELDEFLATREAQTMFLRSNWRRGGLVDRGQAFQATWAAAWHEGRLVAVAAHCWNGVLLVAAEAPSELREVARLAVAHAPGQRRVTGFSGPWSEVVVAREALGFADLPAMTEGKEHLFTLDLDELRVPPALAAGEVVCRMPEEAELALLTEWRIAYHLEALGAVPSEELRQRAQSEIAGLHEARQSWVLTRADRLVAYTGFNATLPAVVQIGGVFTPPDLRGRGYARAAVAGSLLVARGQGVKRAILFTPEPNVAAQAAYRALGFQRAGDYGLVLFR